MRSFRELVDQVLEAKLPSITKKTPFDASKIAREVYNYVGDAASDVDMDNEDRDESGVGADDLFNDSGFIQDTAGDRIYDLVNSDKKKFNEVLDELSKITRGAGWKEALKELRFDDVEEAKFPILAAKPKSDKGLCPVCGKTVELRRAGKAFSRTTNGRVIGSCGDAFTVRAWNEPDEVSEAKFPSIKKTEDDGPLTLYIDGRWQTPRVGDVLVSKGYAPDADSVSYYECRGWTVEVTHVEYDRITCNEIAPCHDDTGGSSSSRPTYFEGIPYAKTWSFKKVN